MLARFSKNEVGRDFVVGDVHGCFTLLEQSLAKVGFDKSTDRLFSVGDLVDRGPESEDAIKWLDYDWFHAVKGNHEELVRASPGLHLANGGAWFISLSIGEQQDFRHAFDLLPIAIEVETDSGSVGLIHAEVPGDDWLLFSAPSISSEKREHMERFALWSRDIIRGRSSFSGVANIGKVFVGHTPVNEVVTIKNVHYIDTGAVFGRALTLACIQGEGAGEFHTFNVKEDS